MASKGSLRDTLALSSRPGPSLLPWSCVLRLAYEAGSLADLVEEFCSLWTYHDRDAKIHAKPTKPHFHAPKRDTEPPTVLVVGACNTTIQCETFLSYHLSVPEGETGHTRWGPYQYIIICMYFFSFSFFLFFSSFKRWATWLYR